MDLKGKEYAKVKDRLQEFRTAHTRARIETIPTFQEDGVIVFKCTILSDKADQNSAEATGHAFGNISKGEKSFEKLETIAVGRALALLGYASDGEIASSEEMEEFEKHKADKQKEMILDATEKLTNTKNLAQLKKVWASLPVEAKTELEKVKEDLKKRYAND
jgi:hypothetical protein